MTAKKESLLKFGVLKEDIPDEEGPGGIWYDLIRLAGVKCCSLWSYWAWRCTMLFTMIWWRLIFYTCSRETRTSPYKLVMGKLWNKCLSPKCHLDPQVVQRFSTHQTWTRRNAWSKLFMEIRKIWNLLKNTLFMMTLCSRLLIADIYISISTETFDIENIKYEKKLAIVRFRYILWTIDPGKIVLVAK